MRDQNGSLRLFIAAELPEEVREVLWTVVQKMKRKETGGLRWARRESFHLTLQFLGNVSSDLVPEIVEAIGVAVSESKPIQLGLEGIGTFGGRKPRVLWVGFSGDFLPLRELVQNMGELLSPLGFAPEKREYSPHVTLARVKRNAKPYHYEQLTKLLEETELPSIPPFRLSKVVLMRSFLHPEGSHYQSVEEYFLH